MANKKRRQLMNKGKQIILTNRKNNKTFERNV